MKALWRKTRSLRRHALLFFSLKYGWHLRVKKQNGPTNGLKPFEVEAQCFDTIPMELPNL